MTWVEARSLDVASLAMEGITITLYDFQPSLQADMAAADLVISHAGAARGCGD